jgi:hypothetical protein
MMIEPDFTTHDYVIGGKMIVGKTVLEETFAELLGRDVDAAKHVKQKLAHDLATYMLENQLLEFTQYKDPIQFQTHITVRAYLAPNDQVKILRLANKIV